MHGAGEGWRSVGPAAGRCPPSSEPLLSLPAPLNPAAVEVVVGGRDGGRNPPAKR